MSGKQEEWKWVINAQTSWLGAPVQELVAHKDLLFGLVRKDLLGSYQQTLLGPLWILVQPIFSVIIYVIVFSRIMGLETAGVPAFLFFLIGITLWNLFSDLLIQTSSTITTNVHIFSKVYFPRLISPLSILVLHYFRFIIHFTLLVGVFIYFIWMRKVDLVFSRMVLCLIPILVCSGFAFGIGLVFSVLTAKYRDLAGLLQILLRLFMFICPVFYSMTTIPVKYRFYIEWNPLAYQFELFRYAFTGHGLIAFYPIILGIVLMIFTLSVGVLLFNKMTDKLMDVA